MPSPTSVDNRVRIQPELWKRFLDKCANQGVPYKQVLESLVMLYLTEGFSQRPQQSGQEHLMPTEIPRAPSDNAIISELMSGDLFS